MLKGKKLKKWIVIIVVVAVVVLIVAGGITMFEHYVNIRGQHLNTYSYSSGGGMTGGYHTETVKRCDGYALITIRSAEWHSDDPVVTEYRTDEAVLDEIEAVMRKYHMNFWNRKKFTNMFVSDGESYSYSFDFDKKSVSFSSQIYPAQYRNKLKAIDEVIKKYIDAGEKLPGKETSESSEDFAGTN